MPPRTNKNSTLQGHFRSSLPPHVSKQVLGATKWCIFRPPPPGDLTRAYVEDAVRERIKRMKSTKEQGGNGRVDLLQVRARPSDDATTRPVTVSVSVLTCFAMPFSL
jgi:hypothetical protein